MSVRVNPCSSVSDADPSPSVSVIWKHLPALGLLLLFWVMAVTSVLNKSATYDEPLHLAGGYEYWTQNEFKLSTENGNLAQRWAALPLLLGDYKFPQGKKLDNFRSSFDFFYNVGNDAKTMLWQGRVMISLLGVLLGFLVYVWSSELFGRLGGLLSLALYSFSPTILANSRLATSDLVVTLCFTASLWSLWRLLHRVSALTLAVSSLCIGALFVSKMSAVLIVPVGLIMLLIRLLANSPLPLVFGRHETSFVTRRSQTLIFLCVLLLQITLVSVVVSAFYGFRYSATKAHAALTADQKPARGGVVLERPPTPQEMYQSRYARKAVSVPRFITWMIRFNRKHHILPEAYLHGLYVVAAYSLVRPAFFNGKYSDGGWPLFFPYCFLVKTPLPVFLILLLAGFAAINRCYRQRSHDGMPIYRCIGGGFYRTAPLWIFLVIYWVVAIQTDLNIGQRHILPVYPITFILAGAAGGLLSSRSRIIRPALAIVFAFFAVESVLIWPNYLAYFNQLVGGPKHAYRHLVDSSLDWGQDLPQLQAWMESHALNGQDDTPVYLSYFGNGNPTYHKINAERLPGYPDLDLKEHELLSLRGGVYCISATMLQMVHIYPKGPWTIDYENTYQSLRIYAQMAQFSGGKSNNNKSKLPANIQKSLQIFPHLQFGRLAAYLRNRKPDDYVGYSILIYRLSDLEVQQALSMPFVQLVEGSASHAEPKP